MSIAIMSLAQARRHKRKFDAVLTIEDPGIRNGLRFHRGAAPDQLILKFDDIDAPRDPWRAASAEDVQAGLDFGRKHGDGKLMVHCFAGIGRSTAMAMAIFADRLGDPEEARLAMLEAQPEACPNLIVLAHADNLLGFDGALLSTVVTWDAEMSRNVRRRLLQAFYYTAIGGESA